MTGGPYLSDIARADANFPVINMLVSYDDPTTFTATLQSVFQTGSQSGTLNDPVSGSETFVASTQLEIIVTPTPWNGSDDDNVFFQLSPPFTVQSDLGITYDLFPTSLAPEPGTGFWYSFRYLASF